MKTIGDIIREKREYLGLTMKQLSKSSGVSASFISEIENSNGAIPKDEILSKLSEALYMTKEEKKELLNLVAFERTPDNIKQELLTLREIVKKTEFVEKVIDGKIVQVGRISNKADSDKAEAIAKMLSEKTPEELEKIEQMMKLMFSK